ncbi:MAG TPA: thiamine pyrophosphate-dependent dehydrogenase E1 component subunit alpha [Mycobacteriales bacterium]|nr:thiamine pyrophosphate-dependent dehydrogenase E1 component subunit alpha [Mycobacteriales bacterium]
MGTEGHRAGTVCAEAFGDSYEASDEHGLDLQLFARMCRIRAFEESLKRLFAKGQLPGFVHLYIGEEAIAVGANSVLRQDDKITSTHRGHGHLIAKGADVRLMMAEIMGRVTGYCKGKGGSMHIAEYAIGILGANGIVGGGIPIATGSALADSYFGRDSVTVAFFGDGASNQGVLHEAMNLASVWRLPVVFLCENNGYTEWMRTEDITAGQIADRGRAFGLECATVDGNDVHAVRQAATAATELARAGGGPSLIEAVTYRIPAHNEGEEVFSGKYRPDEEIAHWRERDPILLHRQRILAHEAPAAPVLEAIEEHQRALVEEAVAFALASEHPEPASALEDLYADGAA